MMRSAVGEGFGETVKVERYLYVRDGGVPGVVDGTRWQKRKKTLTSSDTINGPLSKERNLIPGTGEYSPAVTCSYSIRIVFDHE